MYYLKTTTLKICITVKKCNRSKLKMGNRAWLYNITSKLKNMFGNKTVLSYEEWARQQSIFTSHNFKNVAKCYCSLIKSTIN